MRFTDLLENYIILKDNDKELYYDIKDNINDYMNMIKEYLSYKLIIKDNFIKLEKVPANPQGFMGIKEFDSIKEYVFFMILLIFLEDKNNEEQFILSNLTEYIKQNYSEEKIDWTKQKNRRSHNISDAASPQQQNQSKAVSPMIIQIISWNPQYCYRKIP